MSTTYVGDDTNFPDQITLPSDGDPKPVASVNAGLEGLADAVAFLEARTKGVAKPGTATQVIVPMAPLNVYGLSNEGGAVADRFTFASLAGVGAGWLQTNVTDAGAITLDVGACLPKQCRITSIGVHLACAAHAVDPVAGGATLPQLVVIEEDFGAKASATVLDTVSATPANQALYEAHYYFASYMGGTPYAWDVQYDKRLYVTVKGETNGGGAGAEANKLLIKAVVVTIEEA